MKTLDFKITKDDLTFSGILKIIFKSVWKEFRGIFILTILISCFSAIFQVITPKIFQKIIDLFIGNTYQQEDIVKYSIAAGIFILLTATSIFIVSKLNFYIATQIEDRWKYTSLFSFFKLPMTWHDRYDSGEVGAKLDRGACSIWSIIYEIFGKNLLVLMITLIVVIIYSFYIFPMFAFILFFPIPLYIITTYFISKRIATMQDKLSDLDHTANSVWYDGIGNFRTVKIFGKEYDETEFYSEHWDRYHQVEYKIEKIWALQGFIQKSIEAIMRVVLLLFIIKGVQAHEITIGQIVLLVKFQELTFEPIDQLSQIFTRLKRLLRRASHLFDVVAEANIINKNSSNNYILKDKIQVNNINFTYGNKLVLKNINTSFKVGTTTAIVGKSGSGKSTLAMLLLRFYKQISGTITWDNIDIKSIENSELRKNALIISQDTNLFNRSIKDNISYGDNSLTQKEIEAAAKLAHAHDFIMNLSDGYNSVIGERGIRLSGGQRQRITIARVLAKKPELLIMDEATSHLDSETELAIKEAMQYFKGKHTQIIIAHRLSTVQNADNIILMDEGEIIAEGTHSELYLKNNLYKRLCDLQFNEEPNFKSNSFEKTKAGGAFI